MTNLTMKMLQEQIDQLRNELAMVKASSKTLQIPKGLGVGDTFELAGIAWKVLDITDNGYMCLADRLEDVMVFDTNINKWQESSLRNYLNTEFLKLLSDEIGEDNIIQFERDLLSLDGQTEYGTCEDKVSLLTVDEYRKYRNLIPNTDDYWWWLITPWSTPCNDYKAGVSVVSSSGNFGSRYYCYDRNGVRPFCIFSSSIFESEE